MKPSTALLRSLLLLVTAAAAALLVVVGIGCGGGGGASSQTILYGRGADAQTLDPIHATSGDTVNVLVNLYDTLVAYNDDTTDADEAMQLVPALAERWETSDDGLTWTFHLRPNVRFHDGAPCDAAAIAFNFERNFVPNHPHVHHGVPPYSPNFNMIERVAADGPQRVVFTLKHPSPLFLKSCALFAAGIVSPTALKQHGAALATNPVGTGPYRFRRWKLHQEIVLEANEEYWNGRPANDRVIFIPVVENAVRVQQLRRGEIHIADNLPATELAALEGAPGVTFQRQPGMNVGYLAFQMERPIVKHRKVREAIWHAIDKRRLIETAYAGQAQPAVTMLPLGFPSYHDGLVDRAFDRDRAKALLAEAAAEEGFSLPAKLRLFAMISPRPYMQQPRQTAVFIKDSLEQIGLSIEIVQQDNNLHFQSLSRGEHDLGLIGWTSDTHDPDTFLYSLLDQDNINPDGGNNVAYYRNSELHELLLAAQRELDENKRIELYRRVQEIVFADAPTIPLVHTDQRIAQRTEIKGYYLHPASLARLRHAYLEKSAP